MAESPTSLRSRGSLSRRNVGQYYIRANHLPTALRGWKQFKDFLRSSIAITPGWVRAYPQHKSADCTIRGRKDADAAFEALVNYTLGKVPITAIMWDITDTAGPVLVRRASPAPIVPNSGGSLQNLFATSAIDAYGATGALSVQPPSMSYAVPAWAPHTPEVLYSGQAPVVNVASYTLQPQVATVAPITYAPVSCVNYLPSDQYPQLDSLSIHDRSDDPRSDRPDPPNSTRSDNQAKAVYISKLHKTTSKTDIEALLRTQGVEFHNQILLLLDLKGAFSGVVVVMFADVDKAAEAVMLLQGQRHKGRNIKVTMHPQTHRHPRAAPVVVNGST